LEGLSDHIIATEPAVEAMAAGLIAAAERVNRGRTRIASIRMARDWSATLDPAATRVAGLFGKLSTGNPSH